MLSDAEEKFSEAEHGNKERLEPAVKVQLGDADSRTVSLHII